MGVAKLGYIHTNPDISETAYFFTRIGLLSTQKKWIWSLKSHCFSIVVKGPVPGLKIISSESPDTMTSQIHLLACSRIVSGRSNL